MDGSNHETVEDKVDSCVQDWIKAAERFGRKSYWRCRIIYKPTPNFFLGNISNYDQALQIYSIIEVSVLDICKYIWKCLPA